VSEILVVGAGPVGLTLAAELARHGVHCRIIDRRAEPSPYCRAIGITPRTLELWDDMGIAQDMIGPGLALRGWRTILPGQGSRDVVADLHDLPYGVLGLPQYATERVLAQHLQQRGGEIDRGAGLVALHADDAAVHATIEHGDKRLEQADYRYVVGCDGAHSTVRDMAGIGFVGEAYPMTFMLGDVSIDWDLPRGMALRAIRPREDAAPDIFIAVPLPERGRYRVSTLGPALDDPLAGSDHGIQSERPAPGLEHLQAIADDLLPDRPRLADMRWSSLFRIGMRLAEQYRNGRLFIAGDAAHIHPPTGGQGMNTGIQDAYNLAWKLALVVRGLAPEALLDSYEAERRPVGADVVARTRAASEGLGRGAGRPDRLAETQILVSYRAAGVTGPVPQSGDRAPDCTGLRQVGVGFPLRMFDVLRGTAHMLIIAWATDTVGELERFVAELRARLDARDLRVAVIVPAEAEAPEIVGVQVLRDAEGGFATAWQPESGAGFLVRPDGYVGWRGASWNDAGLRAYLGRMFIGFD
jgi:2-polyprenyl-6-methoxyphenol hydroxylase-like FAD-dependent oxidoreductase